MSEPEISFHEKFVLMVVAAIFLGIMVKIFFF
jgi:hypothetical protein